MRYQQLFPGHKAEQGLLILILIYTLATVTTVVIGGVLSDRSGRRKPAVMFAGYAMAAAAVLLALWPCGRRDHRRGGARASATASTRRSTRRW